ncbi:MAG TPA: MFS transporter [Anaerolineales bacterium]|nr:MFS transporter [Anaerolineales bacterium]HND50026.1 MFS transporter [Anaerolineales bacterium]HNF95200.1 MFS transporter [Anaerolineales bacterium]HNM37630.1 MFS transporter [Anaerolineales bacterium]
MSKEHSRYRWFVVAVFFFFMLLHQTDKLMIGSLQVQISNDFNINNKQWGLVNSGALIVATILYPIWGYLYDRYSRTKLLSLASFIWGSTTWLNAIMKSFGGFLVTRASTGIDDSSYPGLYTLIADYFGPTQRGKIFGILQLAQPIGYLLGMILALMVAPAIGGWRSVFYITGSLGLVIALLIFFGVREMPRGKAEPEFENMTEMQTFKFSWAEAREIFKKKTMWFVFLQGFAGVFPWNVITFFFFAYLEKERGYDANSILFTMAPVILILASGYFVGGALGDYAFKRSNKGRIIVSSVGVLLGALFMYLAITTPLEAKNQFFVFMCLTAIFMPLSSTNVTATVYDVTVPEVRSTAQAVEYFIENAGAAFAPIITGVIADMYDLKTAILLICTVAWGLCFLFYLGAIFTIDKDANDLRSQMAERAKSM